MILLILMTNFCLGLNWTSVTDVGPTLYQHCLQRHQVYVFSGGHSLVTAVFIEVDDLYFHRFMFLHWAGNRPLKRLKQTGTKYLSTSWFEQLIDFICCFTSVVFFQFQAVLSTVIEVYIEIKICYEQQYIADLAAGYNFVGL